MPDCTRCRKSFSNTGNLNKHAKRCKAPDKRLDPIRQACPAGLGPHRNAVCMKTEGRNFRLYPVGRSRPPFAKSIDAVAEMVLKLGQEEGRESFCVDGDYQKTSITLDEADALLSRMWGGSSPTSTAQVLKGCRVTQIPGSVIHLYHTLPGAAPAQTAHEHSDPKATLVLQLVGIKEVELGGRHKVNELQSESQFLTEEETEAFHERSSTRTLHPGNIVCFDKRRIHQLTTVSALNASISITIQ